ncbi:hypothetical protein [Cyanobium sp. Morenito 9A2]|uniref:hypothetical protein n=1 Tax=Cyanobium sp. Morenito 9A2 TaxID=2823718 RepID=UPI0020CB9A11|nr:hypothetical protein [Cyanobium sp. Morenito 9A2]MCP9850590.1 hypothetical protein [Cyanobium sp. Morenito 9A2]
MVAPTNPTYATAYARLASLLNISLASARRKVDLRATQEGLRAMEDKIALAGRMAEDAHAGSAANGQLLDSLLTAVQSEMNFMDED